MKHWSFRNRILFTLLIIICVFSGSTLFIVYTIGDVQQVSYSIQEERLPELTLYAQWTEALRAREAIVQNYLEGANPNTVVANYENLIGSQKLPDYIPSTLASIKTDLERLDFLMVNNVKGLVLYNNDEAAREFILLEYLPFLEQIVDKVDKRQLATFSLLRNQSESMDNSIIQSLWLLLSLTAAAVIGSIVFAHNMSRKISTPVDSLVTQVDTIASGNYGHTIKPLQQMELNQLAQSINYMSHELEQSFTKVLESKTFREQMVDSLPIGIITIMDDESTISLNKAAKEKVAYFNEDLPSLSLENLPEDNYDFWLLFFSKSAFEMKKIMMTFAHGNEVWLVSQVHLLNKQNERIGRLLYFIDVTESTKLEERMKQSEKLATVGEMAAGAAHEIRNPLAVIHGFLAIMEKSFTEEMRNDYYLPLIQKEIRRINVIIEEMLLLAKPNAPMFERNSIWNVLQEIVPLYVNKEDIVFDVTVADYYLYIDPKQMKQVFHNLFRNALDAMGGSGTIMVWSKEDEDHYYVFVKDSGTGMDTETMEKLFEPFFSSKDSGTGLGLSIVQRIMENHGGRIELVSSDETGTIFSLLFKK